MARGNEDFTQPIKVDVNAAFNAFDEVAPRLFSPDNFFRTGAVIFTDDFRDDLVPYRTTVSGAGSAVAMDTSYAHLGAQSVLLTAGAGVGRFAQLTKHLPLPDTQNMGFEWCFNILDRVEIITFVVRVDRDSFFSIYSIRLSSVLGELDFTINSPTVVTIEANDLDDYDFNSWHKIKFIVDTENHNLVIVQFDNRRFVLNATAGQNASGEVNQITASVRITAGSAAARNIRIDAPVFTMDEIAE